VCTLILGIQILGPGTVLLAANRDESPDRPSVPPRLLGESPRIAGGRDLKSGGTWLAIREQRAAIAVLNRHAGAPGSGVRSRGRLALDVANAAEIQAPDFRHGPHEDAGVALAAGALRVADQALLSGRYAPFTLVFASPVATWVLSHERAEPDPAQAPEAPRAIFVPSGWHVLTHSDLDDRGEPRTAWLLDQLGSFAPHTRADAETRLADLLASHGTDGAPTVCIHHRPMSTVSSALVWLAAGEVGYRHAEGPPCTAPFIEYSHLLAAAQTAPELS
jgi:hypothetical protein